jgi:DHA3 family macrolide efflux protein-like MFS transporter
MSQALALLRNRNFLLTWVTSIIEHVALAIAMLVETWYVVDTLHMKAQLGWVMIAATVPRIALMAVGGVLADRIPKIQILTVTFWLRMLVLAGGALLFWQGLMTISALIVVAALFGIMDAFFWPARDALLPSIVAASELTRANSIMQATNQIGLVLGPVIGALLLSLLPLYAIFALTAVMMAAGAITLGMVVEGPAVRSAQRQHFFVDLKEGIRYVLKSPILRSLMMIYIVANLLFTGPTILGTPIIASEHLTTGAKGLSFMQSAFGTGLVLGFITLIVFPPARKRMLMIVGVITVEGIVLGLLGQVDQLRYAVALQLLLGFCIACNNVPMLSLIQQYTDRDKLGRVMALNSMTSMGLAPVSLALISTLLSGGVAISYIMPVFGLTMSAVMLLMALVSAAIRKTD